LRVLVHAVDALRETWSPDVRVDVSILFVTQLGACFACAVQLGVRDVLAVARLCNTLLLTVVAGGAVLKHHAGSSTSLRLLEQRLGVARPAGGHSARAELHARLRAAVSEHDILRVASEALHAYFPAATAQAIAALTPEGETFLAYCQRMAGTLEELEGDVRVGDKLHRELLPVADASRNLSRIGGGLSVVVAVLRDRAVRAERDERKPRAVLRDHALWHRRRFHEQHRAGNRQADHCLRGG
jgi:hypothetical protein